MPLNNACTLMSAVAVAGALLVSSCGGANTSTSAPNSAERDAFVVEASEAANLLGSRLKARLMSTMQNEGPIAAIRVCAEEAPEIAKNVSAETGVKVGRTALRVRNPANAPDAWERETLEHFISAIGSGEDPAALTETHTDVVDGNEVYRWARPIPLEPQCAMCHGTSISPEVSAAIAERYPGDEATGFEVGELRGMFTVIADAK